MALVCLGLSHNTAPVEVRERHGLAPERVVESLVALADYACVREAAIVQTCGRLELYADVDDFETGVAQLRAFLDNFGHPHARELYDLDSFLYTHLGRQAVVHLFRVATGLDSMLIGEADILGQVKDAYVQAQEAKTVGKMLHRLFREALNAGKHARTQTRIGDESASIATAAIEAAMRVLGSLRGRHVLVVGAGKMGRTALRRLRSEGTGTVRVTNRTLSRAQELIDEVGFGQAVEMPDLYGALVESDIVVTSTGASHFVIAPALLHDVMAARPQRPLFIVDIAVPRDVDPRVAAIDNVTLVDIDRLKAVVDDKLEVRREAIPAVEEIIEEFVDRFTQWYQAQLVIPVIASLTRKAEVIRTAELERFLARTNGLTDRDKMLVTGMSMTIVSKLLHSVVTRMRDKVASDRTEALAQARMLGELFDLQLSGIDE